MHSKVSDFTGNLFQATVVNASKYRNLKDLLSTMFWGSVWCITLFVIGLYIGLFLNLVRI